MSKVIRIYRGDSLIADGASAMVDGCPLAACDHAADVFAYLRALEATVFDLATKSITIPIQISREFSDGVRALDHALRAPLVASGQFDLVIEFDAGGGDVHTWTLSDSLGNGAKWSPVQTMSQSGVRVVTQYTVTGGLIAYEGSLADVYDDAIAE